MQLDKQLETRLALLVASGQVDSDIAAFMREAIGELGAATRQTVVDPVFGGLVTHTALALQRVRAGEAVTDWDTDHSDELAAFPSAVATARAFVERATDELGLELPRQEGYFIALHVAAIEQGAA